MNRLMNAILYWISGYLRCRLIKVKGMPYLERYKISTRWGWHVYLHRFLDSDDPAQGVHDHPWIWSFSLLPCGEYVEHRRWGMGTLKRWFNFIGGDHFHLVALVPGVATWSIFVAGPAKPGRPWGMLRRIADGEEGFERGDTQYMFIPYNYGAPGNNEDAVGQKWYDTYPTGRNTPREGRDYVWS